MSGPQRAPLLHRVLREPLLHFALLGALVCGLWALAPARGGEREGVIEVEAQRLDLLVRAHQTQHKAPPSESQRASFVQAIADEEILLREARALGVDRSDPIVRRRLIQKMRFVLEDEAGFETANPSDAELESFLRTNADAYQRSARFDFTQVFAGDASEAELAAIEKALAQGAAPQTLGQAFAHGQTFTGRSLVAVRSKFGEAFARELQRAPLGTWSRVHSSFGWHLIRLGARSEAGLAPLADVRAQVREDWREHQRAVALAQRMEVLRARYEVQLGD